MRVEGVGSRIQGSGCGVQGVGCRLQGVGGAYARRRSTRGSVHCLRVEVVGSRVYPIKAGACFLVSGFWFLVYELWFLE